MSVTTDTLEFFVSTKTDVDPTEDGVPAEDEELETVKDEVPETDEESEGVETSGTVTSEMRSFGKQDVARNITLAYVKHRCRNLLIEFIFCEYIPSIVLRILVHNQPYD